MPVKKKLAPSKVLRNVPTKLKQKALSQKLANKVKPKEVVPDLVRQKIYDVVCNPADLRTNEELADSLDVSIDTIRSLKSDPLFMEAASREFKSRLPSVQIDLLKGLLRDVENGTKTSVASAKTILEALGLIGKNNVYIGIQNNGNNSTSDYAAGLSDLELDAELARLSMELNPSDIMYQNGSFIEVQPIMSLQEEEDLLKEPR